MNSGIDLRPAEAALVRNYEPGHVAARRSCNYIGIVVPEAEIKLLNLDPERLFSINWHRQNAAMVLLKNYVACIERSPPQTSSNVRGAVSRHIIELFGLAAREALGSEPTSDGESIRAARLRLTLAYIARHFAEPDLSITSVAASQSISARYLHRLFETADLQFISHVNEWRLQKAARDLIDPSQADGTIVDIAFNAGFSDISHFNRLFKKRFDATPSAIRTHRS